MIPRSQQCNATQHVGRKSAKELLSLVPFSRVLFCRHRKYANRPKCYDIDRQAQLYPGTRGLLGLWLASILHRQKFFCFLFSKSWEARNNCTPRITKVLKAAVFKRTNKHTEKR
jgi:hypothetical protein